MVSKRVSMTTLPQAPKEEETASASHCATSINPPRRLHDASQWSAPPTALHFHCKKGSHPPALRCPGIGCTHSLPTLVQTSPPGSQETYMAHGSLQTSKVNGGLSLRSNRTPAQGQADREPYLPHVVPTTTPIIRREEHPLLPEHGACGAVLLRPVLPSPPLPTCHSYYYCHPKPRQGDQKAIAGLKVSR